MTRQKTVVQIKSGNYHAVLLRHAVTGEYIIARCRGNRRETDTDAAARRGQYSTIKEATQVALDEILKQDQAHQQPVTIEAVPACQYTPMGGLDVNQ